MRRFPTLALASAIAGLAGIPAASNAAELVQDGSFEGGRHPSPWVQADTHPPGSPVCSTFGTGVGECWDVFDVRKATPRSGRWWAWFGGGMSPVNQASSLRQTVSLSAGTPATLSFWLWIGRGDSSAALNVSLGATTLFAVRGDDARYKHGYTQVVIPIPGSLSTGGPQTLAFDYAGYLGQPVIGFNPYHVFNVDDVALQVPDSDLGVALASTPASVVQGSTFTTTLAAGNAGPHDAGEVRVEYPMPTGATMLGVAGDAHCAAPATAPGYVMHCDFGTLPAGASRTVTVTLRADAVGTVAQSATMPHRTGDPNGGNQVAHAAVTVVAPPAAEPPPPPPKDTTPTCTAPRRFTVPLLRGRKGTGLMLGTHRPASSRITSARMTGPKRFKTVRLSHTRSRVTVDLRRAPAGKYTVRTRVRVSKKRTISVNKTYTACGATRASINAAKRAAAKSKSAAKRKSSSAKRTR